jgi:pSer/pThr/pTyr-binding forkhead associated (FHA) protein
LGDLLTLNTANVIKLTLLHPVQSIPVRSWTFDNQAVIRIGRSTDNNVVLYSAVVSRRHVELRRNGSNWEVINLGSNGTYLYDEPITQVAVVNGLIIQLARSGPKILITLENQELKPTDAKVKGASNRKSANSSDLTAEDDMEDRTIVDSNKRSFFEGL